MEAVMHPIAIANCRDFIQHGKLTLPEGHVYVGRAFNRYGLKASPLANPFNISGRRGGVPVSVRERSIEDFRKWVLRRQNPSWSSQRLETCRLRSLAEAGALTLCCWCAPKRCHAEIIKQVLEEMTR